MGQAVEMEGRAPHRGRAAAWVFAVGVQAACAGATPVPGAQLSSEPVSKEPAAPAAQDDCQGQAAVLCGPFLRVEVEPRLWPEQDRSLSLQLSLSEGGYFAEPESQPDVQRVQVRVVRADGGVTLGEPHPESTGSARRAALTVPLRIDEARCGTGCQARLVLRTRVCREPGMCHEIERPVEIELSSQPSQPSRIGFAWH